MSDVYAAGLAFFQTPPTYLTVCCLLVGYFTIGVIYQLVKFTLLIKSRSRIANAVREEVQRVWADPAQYLLNRTPQQPASKRIQVDGVCVPVDLSHFYALKGEEELAAALEKGYRPRFDAWVATYYTAFWPIPFLIKDMWTLIEEPFVRLYRFMKGLFERYSKYIWHKLT